MPPLPLQVVTHWLTGSGEQVRTAAFATRDEARAEAHRLAPLLGIPADGQVLKGIHLVGEAAALLEPDSDRDLQPD